jgi:hypothetical protein
MRTVALALAVFVFPVSSAIQERDGPQTSGNEFIRMCSAIDKSGKSDEEMVRATACVYYVTGVVDGIHLEWAFAYANTNKESPTPFCLPNKVEGGQIVRVTIEFLRNHPERAHSATSTVIGSALQEAFPCKK